MQPADENPPLFWLFCSRGEDRCEDVWETYVGCTREDAEASFKRLLLEEYGITLDEDGNRVYE